MHIRLFAAAALIALGSGAQAQQSVTDGAKAPLRDLRIDEKKIPDILKLAASAPYSNQNTQSCARIRKAVSDLNAVLGADADAPSDKKGQGGALAAAGSRAVVGSIIPGFGLVRLITGADKQEKRVEAAILGGVIRRSYLKGVAAAKGCTPPAAPTAAARAEVPQLPPPEEDKDEKDKK